ncbi:uncharacterized protein RSE6_09554 [Rhynchosporium secalis]|uniref:Uncharacterized protein n=1 Tax=Rhynchosporium secalis TaxID=38038 RepID=A0A1E1MI83_RHYSE|nr:uncharacterized protein RSE6_09554 [Rhynchosporium secalis]
MTVSGMTASSTHHREGAKCKYQNCKPYICATLYSIKYSSINGDRSDVEVVFVFAPNKLLLYPGLHSLLWNMEKKARLRRYANIWHILALVDFGTSTQRYFQIRRPIDAYRCD